MNFAAAIRKDMYNRDDTHDMLLVEVSKDGMLLRNVKHQTPAICRAALQQNWRALQFVQDLNEFLVGDVIRSCLEAASLLPPSFHLYAVCVDISCFDFIAKPSMECCCFVIQKIPEWISKRPNPPLELCLLAVKGRYDRACFEARYNSVYRTLDESLRRDYLEGIRVGPAVLAELQKAALGTTGGWALLEYPPAAQAALAEEALRQNPALYAFVSHLHTPALDRVVCKANPKLLATITNPTRDLVWEIAGQWHAAIRYAEEQDEELCVHAVRTLPAAIAYVRKHRFDIWKKAGHLTTPSLTTLYPEFAGLIVKSATARTFFTRIQRAMSVAPVKMQEALEDPVTLEPVAAGSVCGFLHDAKGVAHFVGTLDTLLDLLLRGFQGSNTQHLFIPLRNALVPTALLRWRTIA